MALCLTIKEYEFFYIGDVRVSIQKDKGRKFRVWIEAPSKNTIVKREGYEPKTKEAV